MTTTTSKRILAALEAAYRQAKDNVFSARYNFRGMSATAMREEHGDSGCSRASNLATCEQEEAEALAALKEFSPTWSMRRMFGTTMMMAALALASLTSVGCASAGRPLDVETVGQLTPSETNVFTVAVHADTPLATEAFVVAASDDEAATMVQAVSDPAIVAKDAHGY